MGTEPLPFTQAQFFDVFAAYNRAIWPAQIIAYLLAATAIALLFRKPAASRAIATILALLWIWTGVVYHLIFFAAINRAAWLFGAAFILQGLVFVYFGVRRKMSFGFSGGIRGWAGVLFIVYAAIVYPLIGHWAGHDFPSAPSFGVTPCPLTIFTLGLLLLARAPRVVLVIPLLWSLVGGMAAILLGVPQDWALLISGPLFLLCQWKRT